MTGLISMRYDSTALSSCLIYTILILLFQYLRVELVKDFGLSTTVKPKPVLGPNDILLLLTHHWARDTCTFPTEDQRVSFAAILLFFIYTGCRPAELVDSSKSRNGCQASWDDLDDPDSEGPDCEGQDLEQSEDLDCEGQDLKQSEDPDYDKPDPWECLDNGNYSDDNDSLSNFNKLIRLYKAICYKDVRLQIVQNSKQGEQDLLAIKVTLFYYKGADKKPKP